MKISKKSKKKLLALSKTKIALKIPMITSTSSGYVLPAIVHASKTQKSSSPKNLKNFPPSVSS